MAPKSGKEAGAGVLSHSRNVLGCNYLVPREAAEVAGHCVVVLCSSSTIKQISRNIAFASCGNLSRIPLKRYEERIPKKQI